MEARGVVVVPPFECLWLDGEGLAFPQPGRGRVSFEVRGENDATVILKDSPGHRHYRTDLGRNYTVVIGSHRNRSIRVEADGRPAAEVDAGAAGALDPNSFRRFWVNVCEGTVSVGHGPECSPAGVLLQLEDPRPNRRVRCVGLSSWDKHVAYRHVRLHQGLALPLLRAPAGAAAPVLGAGEPGVPRLLDFCNSEVFADVKLLVGPEKLPFHAHRVVLASCSPAHGLGATLAGALASMHRGHGGHAPSSPRIKDGSMHEEHAPADRMPACAAAPAIQGFLAAESPSPASPLIQRAGLATLELPSLSPDSFTRLLRLAYGDTPPPGDRAKEPAAPGPSTAVASPLRLKQTHGLHAGSASQHLLEAHPAPASDASAGLKGSVVPASSTSSSTCSTTSPVPGAAPELSGTLLSGSPLPYPFSRFFLSPEHADVIVRSSDSECQCLFPAHRVALGSRSRVLQRMLCCGMREGRTQAATLGETSCAAVASLLHFLYRGTLPGRSPRGANTRDTPCAAPQPDPAGRHKGAGLPEESALISSLYSLRRDDEVWSSGSGRSESGVLAELPPLILCCEPKLQVLANTCASPLLQSRACRLVGRGEDASDGAMEQRGQADGADCWQLAERLAEEGCLPTRQLLQLLHLSDRLCMPALTRAVSEELGNSLSVETAVEVLCSASALPDCPALHLQALSFVTQHLQDCLRADPVSFVRLSPSDACALLEDCCDEPRDEPLLASAAMSWILGLPAVHLLPRAPHTPLQPESNFKEWDLPDDLPCDSPCVCMRAAAEWLAGQLEVDAAAEGQARERLGAAERMLNTLSLCSLPAATLGALAGSPLCLLIPSLKERAEEALNLLSVEEDGTSLHLDTAPESALPSPRPWQCLQVDRGRRLVHRWRPGRLVQALRPGRCLGEPAERHELQYICDGDNNGVLFFAGTSYGKHPWMNPVVLGTVQVTASSPPSRHTDGKILASRKFAGTSFAGPGLAEGRPSAWWQVDLGEAHSLACNFYTLRQDGSSHFPRSWVLEGSRDSVQWEALRVHSDEAAFSQAGQYASWPVNSSFGGSMLPCRYFRIRLISPVSLPPSWKFCACFVELYGSLIQDSKL